MKLIINCDLQEERAQQLAAEYTEMINNPKNKVLKSAIINGNPAFIALTNNDSVFTITNKWISSNGNFIIDVDYE